MPRPESTAGLGVVQDDARQHRRPLFPPAERSLVWSAEEVVQRERTPFRPLILPANEPRLIVDLDSAGGLSGHGMIGLAVDSGVSKWFHAWREIDVRYVRGCLEYSLRDPDFPGVIVRLQLAALADSVGFVVKVAVDGLTDEGHLVWVFGGASGFQTNYDHGAAEFSYSPQQCADNTIRWSECRFTLEKKGTFVLHGGSSWSGEVGFGDPEKVLVSPAALCASARWCAGPASQSEANRVAVGKIRVGSEPAEGWIIVGRGGKIETWLDEPAAAAEAARTRNEAIADRILVRTPDPYLNQAMPMIALATDGIWGDAAILHGAWSWRKPIWVGVAGTDRCATAGPIACGFRFSGTPSWAWFGRVPTKAPWRRCSNSPARSSTT